MKGDKELVGTLSGFDEFVSILLQHRSPFLRFFFFCVCWFFAPFFALLDCFVQTYCLHRAIFNADMVLDDVTELYVRWVDRCNSQKS
jgi:hypothetical protein